jgi:hypothetical protein
MTNEKMTNDKLPRGLTAGASSPLADFDLLFVICHPATSFRRVAGSHERASGGSRASSVAVALVVENFEIFFDDIG